MKPSAAAQPKPWAAYTRVSTDEQAQHGISLDAQRSGVEALAKAYGHRLADVIVDDGYSAGSMKRPGVRRLVDLIERREIAGVIIWKLDRLFRNTLDCLQQVAAMKRAGVELVSVNERIDTSTAMGEAFLTMQAAFAQLERQQISERVSAAFAHLRTLGRWIGGTVPSGLALETRADGKRYLVVDPKRGPVVRDAWRRVIEGATIRQVAAYLTDAGVPTRGGDAWGASQVSHLLKVKKYIGTLIDQETYDRAQAALAARANPTNRRRGIVVGSTAKTSTQRVWRLQSIAFCARCSMALVGVSARGANGESYAYLRCSGRIRRGSSFCAAGDVPAQAWEDVVVERLVRFLTGHRELPAKLAELHAKSQADAGPAKDERDRLVLERDALQQRLAAALDASLAGGAVARAYAARIEAMQHGIEALETRIAGLVGQLAAADLSAGRLDEIAEAMRAEGADVTSAPWEEQRTFLRRMVARVDLASGVEGQIVMRHAKLLGHVEPIPGQFRTPSHKWFTSDDLKRNWTGPRIALQVREMRGARGKKLIELHD